MAIEAKKIKLVQDILKLEDEALLMEIEQILKSKRAEAYKNSLSPISTEDLEERIDQSVSDFESGRYKNADELLKKYGK
jgi:hypothetical protein